MLAIVLVGIVAGFVTGSSGASSPSEIPAGTSYRASTTLIVDPTLTVPPIGIQRAAFFTTVGVVPERVRAAVEFEGEAAVLAATVTTVAEPELGTLQISTTQSDPDRAVLYAQTFADQLLIYLDEQGQAVFDTQLSAEVARLEQLEAEIDQFDRQVTSDPDDLVLEERRRAAIRELGLAEQRLSQLTASGPSGSGLVVLEDPVAVPISTGGRAFTPPASRASRIPLFAGIALGLGAALALLLERLDTRIRTRPEAEEAFGLPVIGEVLLLDRRLRRTRAIVSLLRPRSPEAESYRSLRTAITYVLLEDASDQSGSSASVRRTLLSGQDQGRVVLVTSAEPGEGKTTTVANLAAAFAERGESVLVLDCDFRCSRVGLLLGQDRQRGLSDLLVEGAPPHHVSRAVVPTSIPGVQLLPNGTADGHPPTFLATVGALVEQVRRLADVVLVDTSPILAANDVAELIPTADVVVVLVRNGRVGRDAAVHSGEVIRRLAPARAGLVMIGAAEPSVGGYGGYGYLDQRTRGFGARVRRLIGLDSPRSEPASREGDEAPAPIARPGDDRAEEGDEAPAPIARPGDDRAVEGDEAPAPIARPGDDRAVEGYEAPAPIARPDHDRAVEGDEAPAPITRPDHDRAVEGDEAPAPITRPDHDRAVEGDEGDTPAPGYVSWSQ